MRSVYILIPTSCVLLRAICCFFVVVVKPCYASEEAAQLPLLSNHLNHNRLYLSPISLLEKEEEIH